MNDQTIPQPHLLSPIDASIQVKCQKFDECRNIVCCELHPHDLTHITEICKYDTYCGNVFCYRIHSIDTANDCELRTKRLRFSKIIKSTRVHRLNQRKQTKFYKEEKTWKFQIGRNLQHLPTVSHVSMQLSTQVECKDKNRCRNVTCDDFHPCDRLNFNTRCAYDQYCDYVFCHYIHSTDTSHDYELRTKRLRFHEIIKHTCIKRLFKKERKKFDAEKKEWGSKIGRDLRSLQRQN